MNPGRIAVARILASRHFAEYPGFPGYYCRDVGTIWSALRNGRRPNNEVGIICDVARQLSPGLAGEGYLALNLRKDGKTFQRYVHRMLLESFVSPCPEGMEGCHNDGIKTNNDIRNLRWDTPEGNNADKETHGTLLVGSAIRGAKLIEAMIPEIFARHFRGESTRAIAEWAGVSRSTIARILAGETWGHAM